MNRISKFSLSLLKLSQSESLTGITNVFESLSVLIVFQRITVQANEGGRGLEPRSDIM